MRNPNAPRSIFESRVEPNINTPIVVQRGVVDTSTADAISSVGKFAIEAYQGYEEAKIEKETEQLVEDLFTRKFIESESEVGIEERLRRAQEQTFALADDEAHQGFGAEDPAIKEMSATLSKLERADSIGAISKSEFNARVETIIKQAKNRLPGHADTLTRVAREVLGDNSARIEQIFKVDEDAKAEAKAIRSAELKTTATIAAENGVSIGQVTDAMRKDYFITQQAKKQLEATKRNKEFYKLEQGEKDIGYFDRQEQAAGAILISSGKSFYDTVRNFSVDGVNNIATLAQTGGYQNTIDTLFKDETKRNELASKLKLDVFTARRTIMDHYARAAREHPSKSLKDFAPYYEPQIAELESLTKMLDDKDFMSTQFGSYIDTLLKSEQGSIAGLTASNPLARVVKSLGSAGGAFVQTLMTDSNFDTLPPELKGMFEQAKRNISQPGGVFNTNTLNSYTNSFEKVLSGEKTFTEIEGLDEGHANFVLSSSWNHVLNTTRVGFPTDSPENNTNAKNAFVQSSKVIVGSINPSSPKGVETLSKHLNNPLYLKLLDELDPTQKDTILETLNGKYRGIINGVPGSDLGLIQRIKAAKDRQANAVIPKGPGRKTSSAALEADPDSAVVKAALAQTDRIPQVTLKGLELTTTVREGEASEDVELFKKEVITLNKMVKDAYKIQNLIKPGTSYKKFVTDFYKRAFLGETKEQVATPAAETTPDEDTVDFKDWVE